MTLDDFKREYPAITSVLHAEGRAQLTGEATPDPATVPFHVVPRPEGRRSASPASVRPKASGVVPSPSDTSEQGLRREWDSNATTRAEFVRFEIFAAFRRAESRGAVKIMARSAPSN